MGMEEVRSGGASECSWPAGAAAREVRRRFGGGQIIIKPWGAAGGTQAAPRPGPRQRFPPAAGDRLYLGRRCASPGGGARCAA